MGVTIGAARSPQRIGNWDDACQPSRTDVLRLVAADVRRGCTAVSGFSRFLDRAVDWIRTQGDVRRGAVLGIGCGLLVCVIMFIAILLVSYAGSFGK